MNRASLVGKETGYRSGLIDFLGCTIPDQCTLTTRDLSLSQVYRDLLDQIGIRYSLISYNLRNSARDEHRIIVMGRDKEELARSSFVGSQSLLLSFSNSILPNEDTNLIIGWLTALMDWKASISLQPVSIRLCLPSDKLLRAVKYALDRLGIEYRYRVSSLSILRKDSVLKFYSLLALQSDSKREKLKAAVEKLQSNTGSRYKRDSEEIYALYLQGLSFTEICRSLGISTTQSSRLYNQLLREGYRVDRKRPRPKKNPVPILPADDLDIVYERLKSGESGRSILRSYGLEKRGSSKLLDQLERAGYSVDSYRRRRSV